MDRAEHPATRPGWSCAVCREPWPCPPAKADLAEQYRGQHTALRIYIAGQLWNAIDDAMLTELGPSPCGLRGRFLDWVDRLAGGERLGELTVSTDFPEPVAALLGGNVWAHDEVKDWIATHPDALLHLFSPAARP